MKHSAKLLTLAGLLSVLQVLQAQIDPVKRVRELFGAKPQVSKFAPKAQAFKTKSIALSTPGRSVNYYWDDFNSSWVYSDTSLYQYDAVGRIVSETHRNGGPVSRTQFTFSASGELIKEYGEFWNSMQNNWDPTYRDTYVYNSQGILTLFTNESFDSSSQLWELQYGMKALLTYNANGQLLDNIIQSWDNMSQSWENSFRETGFVYDLAGNILQYEGKNFNNNVWENSFRYKLVYGANNQPSILEIEYWGLSSYEKDTRFINLSFHNWCGFYCNQTLISTGTIQAWGSPQANQWNTVSRTNITLDAFGGRVQLDEEYLNGQWQNQFRYTESFDNQYRYTGWKYEDWNSGSNQWEVNSQSVENHSYDASFNLTQTIFQNWNSQDNALMNTLRKDYSDFQMVVGLNETLQGLEFQIYPNPVETEITIFSGNSVSKIRQFTLYDAYGRVLLSSPLEEEQMTLNRGDLAAGIYVYELLSSNGAKQNGKLILK